MSFGPHMDAEVSGTIKCKFQSPDAMGQLARELPVSPESTQLEFCQQQSAKILHQSVSTSLRFLFPNLLD